MNEIAGGTIIFIFLSYAVIAFLSAQSRFPSIITLAIFTVWLLLISIKIEALLPLALLFIGVFFGISLMKLFTKS